MEARSGGDLVMNMSPRTPAFPWSISLGNVLQILITTAVVAGAFYTVDQRSQTNAREIEREAEQRAELRDQVSRDIVALEGRVRSLEQSFARSDERLANILTLLGRIDNRLEKFEAKFQP